MENEGGRERRGRGGGESLPMQLLLLQPQMASRELRLPSSEGSEASPGLHDPSAAAVNFTPHGSSREGRIRLLLLCQSLGSKSVLLFSFFQTHTTRAQKIMEVPEMKTMNELEYFVSNQ